MESIQWGDLIPWINFAVMVLSALLIIVYQLKS